MVEVMTEGGKSYRFRVDTLVEKYAGINSGVYLDLEDFITK